MYNDASTMCARARLLVMCAVAVFCGLVGCEREEIHTYKVPKGSVRMQPAGVASPQSPKSSQLQAGHVRMRWTVPDGWRQVPGQREMRVATFEATGGTSPVEAVVSSFPGQAGGLLPNVNRWRRQLNLEPIGQQELAGHLTPFINGQVRGYTLDFTGPDGDSQKRIVGAIILEGAQKTWFVKAMDSPVALEPHRDAVWRFAESFQLTGDAHSGDDGQADHAGHDHSDHAEHDSHAHPAPASTGNGPAWRVPGHWVRDPSPSSILSAAFNISNDAGDARATITLLKGDGGGMLSNINRWRGQLGLPPVRRLDEQPVASIGDPSGARVVVIDLLAPGDEGGGRERYVIAMFSHEQKTWFFKLTGPQGAVEVEKDAFEQLVLSTISP
jgi:hypothetical protein